MKSLLSALTFLSISLNFIACSGIKSGFDEDSVFYKAPQKSFQEQENRQVTKKLVKTQDEYKENETTFSYDPNAGYE